MSAALPSLTTAGRAGVFAVSAAACTGVCMLAGQAAYLAPFMASAAVLAGAGPVLPRAAVSLLAVYLLALGLGALGHVLMPVAPVTLGVVCVLGYVVCLLLGHQHPPALAMLALAFTRQPGWDTSAWLMGAAVATAAGAWLGARLAPWRRASAP